MKKILLFPMIAIALFMVACSDKDNNITDTPVTPPVDDRDEYTLLFYGMGGGSKYGSSTLDYDIVARNINDMINAYDSIGDKRNIVINYKFSPAFSDSAYAHYNIAGDSIVEAGQKSFFDYKGLTYRFAVEKGKDIFESFCDENIYGPVESDYANTDSLTNFINWAVANYPAKKYILVIADHGGGYMPHTDIPSVTTRDIMNEATFKTSFSVHSLKSALMNANAHLDVLYFDACLMNSVEYLYELKDQADYIVASTFLVPGVGGNYKALVKMFGENDDTESALVHYPDSVVKFWADNKSGNYYDITVTRCSMLNEYANVLKEFTDNLCQIYENGTTKQRYFIEEITRGWTFRVLNSTSSFLLKNYVYDILSMLGDAFPEDLLNRFESAHDKTILSAATSPYFTKNEFDIDHSVVMGANGDYSINYWDINWDKLTIEPWLLRIYEHDGSYSSYYDFEPLDEIYDISNYLVAQGDSSTAIRGEWPSTFADTYSTLEFSRLTNWDRWISTCQVHPFSLSPADFELDIFGGSDDEEGEGEQGGQGSDEAKLKALHKYRIRLDNVKPTNVRKKLPIIIPRR